MWNFKYSIFDIQHLIFDIQYFFQILETVRGEIWLIWSLCMKCVTNLQMWQVWQMWYKSALAESYFCCNQQNYRNQTKLSESGLSTLFSSLTLLSQANDLSKNRLQWLVALKSTKVHRYFFLSIWNSQCSVVKLILPYFSSLEHSGTKWF